ncbi:MAG: glycoside hydrolase family 2 TIM barrel-domain containing protein [Planctomycetota bacterium]
MITMRIDRNENVGWRFAPGEVEGAAKPSCDDRAWRRVDLPHDYMIEGAFDPDAATGAAGAFLPGGVGWYRKTLPLDPAWRGRRVQLDFDGVMADGRVFVNGVEVDHRPNGYVGFRVDITDPLAFDGENVVAVRTDTSDQPASRWYTGGGLYRDVRLVVVDPLHIPRDGLVVTTPSASADEAVVAANAEVINASDRDRDVTVRLAVRRDGETVAETTRPLTVAASGAAGAAGAEMRIERPALWSPDHPNLYEAVCTLIEDDRTVDETRTMFGIRSVAFDPGRGLLVNGVPTKLKGVCNHHDLGPLGAACFRDAVARRLAILQGCGCNAIRCAHNGFSRHFYDLCDRMGVLVIDEIFDEWRQAKVPCGYHRCFDEWCRRDLADQVRAHRNHPSIIAWSLGNEIREKGEREGVEILKALKAACRQHDPTRPVTAGSNTIEQANASGFTDQLDVVGINGGGGSCFRYDDCHRQYPDRALYGSEVPHTFAVRGVYKTRTWYRDKELHPKRFATMTVIDVPDLTAEEVFPEAPPTLQSSYDNALVRVTAAASWRLTAERAFMAGEFRWTGADYLGESMGWPAKTYNSGIVDLCGIPKDPYYLYQSLWTDDPMVHLLPHWTHPGKEGVVIPVWAYTNGDEAELLLDGRSLGRKAKGDAHYLPWDVPYRPGTLHVKAWRDGALAAEQTVTTAGAPRRVMLEPYRPALAADRMAVVHVLARIVDAAGTLQPHAGHRLGFHVDGPGEIIAVAGGDPLSNNPLVATACHAFNGMALCIVRSTARPGTITITAEAAGLQRGTATVEAG